MQEEGFSDNHWRTEMNTACTRHFYGLITIRATVFKIAEIIRRWTFRQGTFFEIQTVGMIIEKINRRNHTTFKQILASLT